MWCSQPDYTEMETKQQPDVVYLKGCKHKWAHHAQLQTATQHDALMSAFARMSCLHCVCTGHTGELCKKWLNRLKYHLGADSCGSTMGSRSMHQCIALFICRRGRMCLHSARGRRVHLDSDVTFCKLLWTFVCIWEPEGLSINSQHLMSIYPTKASSKNTFL